MSEEYRRLYRSRRDRVIGGVCGGLADYLNVDVTIIRIIWLLAVLFGGGGLVAYLIAWIIVPGEPGTFLPSGEDDAADAASRQTARTFGIILIVIALLWIAYRFGFHFFAPIPWTWVLPVLLIVLGVAILLRPGIQRAAESADSVPPPSGTPAATEEAESGGKTGAEEPGEQGEEQPPPGENKTAGSESSFDVDWTTERLTRSRRDRVLFGVCGGLGKKLNVDSTLVRLAWVLFTVFGVGVFIIIYLVMALVVPEET